MYQQQIFQFCNQFYSNILIQDRTIIFPYELDIVIPEIKLAIEFNGIKYHSNISGTNKYYHSQKYELCKQKGYQLLIIWDFQWKKNKDIIKNNIKSYFNNSLIPQNINDVCSIIINNNYITQYKFNNNYNISYCLNQLIKSGTKKILQLGKQPQRLWLNSNFKLNKFIQPKQKFKWGLSYYNCGYIEIQKK